MHTYVQSDVHPCAIGKARRSAASQGRPRLKALIDPSYGWLYVPRPHLSVCVCVCVRVSVCCRAARWKWQRRERFCHPSLKRKVRCAMLVIHQDIDCFSGGGFGLGGVREVEILKSKDIRITCSTNLSSISEDIFKFKWMLFFLPQRQIYELRYCVWSKYCSQSRASISRCLLKLTLRPVNETCSFSTSEIKLCLVNF